MPKDAGRSGEGGVPEALRAAIERTLAVAGKPARAGSAALRPERATQLLDEVARRGPRPATSSPDAARTRARGWLVAAPKRAPGSRVEGRGPAMSWPSGSKLWSGGSPVLEDALRSSPKPKSKAED